MTNIHFWNSINIIISDMQYWKTMFLIHNSHYKQHLMFQLKWEAVTIQKYLVNDDLTMALLDRHFRCRVCLQDAYNNLKVNYSLWRQAILSADTISTAFCRAATAHICPADWPACNSGTTHFRRRASGRLDRMANTCRGRLPGYPDYSNPRCSVATARPRRVLRGPVPPSTGILPRNWNTRWSPSDSPAEKKRSRSIRQRLRSRKTKYLTGTRTHIQFTGANSNRARVLDVDPLGEQVAAVRKVQERVYHDRPYDSGYARYAIRWHCVVVSRP